MTDIREQVLASMRGSSATIPDFMKMISHYSLKVHSQVRELDEDVHRALELIFPNPKDKKRLDKMKSASHAFLGASWWPYPTFEALCVVTHLGVWLFCWDDEFDSHEFSSMIHDGEAAKRFRQETVSYVEASLSQDKRRYLSEISTNPLITSFDRIAQAVLKSYNTDQIQTLLRELRYYIEMTEEEQIHKGDSCLPPVNDYIHRRLGTSAVGPSLAIHEYALGIQIPQNVMQSHLMQTVWRETNFIISITNDVFSLKKEVVSVTHLAAINLLADPAQDQCEVDSLVPILVLKRGSLQAAIDEATDMVQASVKRLDAAEESLLTLYSSPSSLNEDLKLFLESCKHACTGNLCWRVRRDARDLSNRASDWVGKRGAIRINTDARRGASKTSIN
ncbi:hypothetical protein NUW58_g3885 [Xylaria curta]|uniref:Uncharacterized protein n=1 Tax=Xylaria curta TaxID=42375 RepID=A0ACC1PAB0_9PEZI|nr:hypothetical protein NUW58_g3885 [Xylaria curta]